MKDVLKILIVGDDHIANEHATRLIEKLAEKEGIVIVTGDTRRHRVATDPYHDSMIASLKAMSACMVKLGEEKEIPSQPSYRQFLSRKKQRW